MKILVADLIMKDTSLSVLLMHVGFCTPSVDDYDDLIGPLSRLFVDVRHGCENVGGMGGIHCVYSYAVDKYFF